MFIKQGHHHAQDSHTHQYQGYDTVDKFERTHIDTLAKVADQRSHSVPPQQCPAKDGGIGYDMVVNLKLGQYEVETRE